MKTTSLTQAELYTVALLAIACLFTFLSYYPGLSGSFILDDIDQLATLNQYGGVVDLNSLRHFVFGNSSGSLGRPVSMLSFLLNDQYYPGDPSSYKLTNLQLHIICGLLIFLFLYKLLVLAGKSQNDALLISLSVTVLWLFHPLNVSTVLYVIQRMTQLMAIFSVAGLIFYIYGREIITHNTSKGILLITASIIPFGILGTLSKENGFLIVFYIYFIESLIFKNQVKPQSLKVWLGIFVYFPIIALISYFIYKWDTITITYINRDFTLTERLLTECRVIVDYIYRIVIPSTSGSGVFHDDYTLSHSFFDPPSTIFALLFIVTSLAAAIKVRKYYPLLSLAISWFFIGHLLESTFIPLEIYFEHRNYLPMIGILLGVCLLIEKLLHKINISSALKKAALSLPMLILLALGFLTHQSATIWGTPTRFLALSAYEHPNSLRAQSIYGRYLDKIGNHEKAYEILLNTYQKHPQDIGLALALLTIACKNDQAPPFSYKYLSEVASESRYSGHFTSLLKNFIDINLRNQCFNNTREQLHIVLHALEEVRMMMGSSKIDLLLMHSDVYVLDGNLDMAIKTLDEAYSRKPLPVIAARQAQLLASAGLYEEALVRLEKSKNGEKNRSLVLPSQNSYYNKLEQEIKILMARNTSPNDHRAATDYHSSHSR